MVNEEQIKKKLWESIGRTVLIATDIHPGTFRAVVTGLNELTDEVHLKGENLEYFTLPIRVVNYVYVEEG